MITAQQERLNPAFITEAEPIFSEHHEEISTLKDKIDRSIRWEIYFALQEREELLMVTLRKDGALIGYFFGCIMQALHYSECRTMVMDMFFVRKSERGQRGGVKLFRVVEDRSKAMGVQMMYVGHKLHHPEAGRLFKAMGFKPVEMFFNKWIGG